jgi:hypothetical protein
MTSYILNNDCNAVLRIILEPEGFIYDIKANQKVAVTVNGESPAFECSHSVDKEGVRCISFWPDRGTVAIDFNGQNIINLIQIRNRTLH